jgi:hypothetical protein
MAAHNFIPYTISSDNTSQPNFNFVIDVNETGGASNPLARLIYPKQPSVNTLTFDVGSVLKNYVSYDALNVSATVIAANTNSRVNYYCEFRELYDVSGIPTLSNVLVSDPTTPSSTVYNVASNAVFDFEDYSALAYANCNVSGFGFLNATLTENEEIDLDQYRVLTFLDPNRVVTNVKVTANGIGPTTIPVTLTSNNFLFNINAGKFLFDTAGAITTPSTIVVQVLAGSTVLGTKTYQSPTSCSQYETVRLHWLNKLGGFEAYNFNKSSKKSENINRKQFKAPLQIGYSKSERLKTNYNTTIEDSIQVNSDWISDELAEYFEQLMTSPVIYLERSATDLIAVNITNTNYQTKKFMDNRQMFNISFDIEYTYNRYRQTL